MNAWAIRRGQRNSTVSTVALVDDDAQVRRGLARLFDSAGYDVETFESADAFLAREYYEDVGCLVLDLQLPGISGVELQQRLETAIGHPAIVFLSGHADVPDSVRAMKQGAVDFLTKPVEADLLLAAVAGALERWHGQRGSEAEREAIQGQVDSLTARELQTMRWVIAGFLNKQIAVEFGIAEKTVKVHRARVMQKMGVSSVAVLVRRCAIAGVQPVPERR
ncbi:MAG: response regulator [Salinisphaera sp.]|uniref:response regulator transcription factor n=1 Tax=Salinisphaera sp. TaxID=1914330 RepID=UPI003C79B255